jgi:hypothetical protein
MLWLFVRSALMSQRSHFEDACWDNDQVQRDAISQVFGILLRGVMSPRDDLSLFVESRCFILHGDRFHPALLSMVLLS